MHKLSTAFLFLFLILANSAISQQSIRWRDKPLEAAIQIAAIEDKMVFVDTYTKTCAPCKVMDRNLKDPQLVKYFNKHFVNVKIDMNSPNGRAIKSEYELVFLPTLMILDKYGNVKYKVDEVVEAEELLYKGRLVREQDYEISDASAISSTPVHSTPVSSSTPPPPQTNLPPVSDKQLDEIKPSDIESDEKILFVLGGDNQDVPPFILKEEAYHRLSLANGSHRAAARKYLERQTDWGSEENIRFIFDFLHTTQDTLFRFMIQEKAIFEDVIGQGQVDRAIHMMVNDRLERGYPRPDLSEAINLYQLIDSTQFMDLACTYQLYEYYKSSDDTAYIDLAYEYISDVNPNNTSVMDKSVRAMRRTGYAPPKHVEHYITSINNLPSDELSPSRLESLARLHLLVGHQKEAKRYLDQAIELAQKSNIPYSPNARLRKDVEGK